MEDDIRAKNLPADYGSDAIRVLNTMSFTKGKGVGLLGSMSLRSQQYAGDYDAFEIVNMKERTDEVALHMLATRFKQIMKEVRAIPNTYIGDIKAGSIEEWRVLPKSAMLENGKVVGMDVEKSKAVLDRLRKDNIISEKEYKESLSLLEGTMTPMRLLEAKKELKFHIVRWTPPEVERGFKVLQDKRRFTLEEAFSTPTITKMDVISLVQNNRYTDFSMIYYFRNKGTLLNPDVVDIAKSIKENIYYYTQVGNPFKALKRKFALAKMEKDAGTITKLTPILNSDLGRIYHVLGDIGTLIHLLEDFKPDQTIVRFEIDQFRNRLANVYQLKDYLKEEHTIIGEIESLLKAPLKSMLPKLEAMEERLDRILKDGTNKVMKGKQKVSDTMIGGVVQSYQWTRGTSSHPLIELDRENTSEVVSDEDYPYKVKVDQYIYHSPIRYVILSGKRVDIDETKITPEGRELLKGLLPKYTTAERTQIIQQDFAQRKERAAEEARQDYLQSSAGQRQLFEERYQKYLEEHPEQRFFTNVMDVLTQGADYLMENIAPVVGVPQQVIDFYKTFTAGLPRGGAVGGAIDITNYYPVGQSQSVQRGTKKQQIQTGTKKEQVVTGTRMVTLQNPEWDPKRPVKGVKKTHQVPVNVIGTRVVPIMTEVEVPNIVSVPNKDYVDDLITLTKRLSHFYSFRDPATALGFRMLGDELWRQYPVYENKKRRTKQDKGHEDAVDFTMESMLGVNRRNRFAQPNPKTRYANEVEPLLPKAYADAAGLQPRFDKKGRPIYLIPPADEDQAVFYLGDAPFIRGPTMYQ